MNLLHVSDYHYDGNNQTADKIISAVIKSVKNAGKSIDFILFTGDLVNTGSVPRYFNEAKDRFLKPLSDALGVEKKNVIICPGNHDISFEDIHYSNAHIFLNEVRKVEDLDDIVKGKGADKFIYPTSLDPLRNYKEFVQSYYEENEKLDIFADLYSTHIRTYQGKKIVFVDIYTPWLSNIDNTGGKNDYGQLLFPICVMEQIEKTMPVDAYKKILLMHHPISFLRDFNGFEMEQHIYGNFDMVFAGHIHKASNSSHLENGNGIYEHITKASLVKKDNIGCTYIENDDIEDNVYRVSEISYVRDSAECHFGTAANVVVPIGEDKEEKNRLRQKIYDKVGIEKINADNLLLLKDDENGQDFLQSYNNPVIRTNSESAISGTMGMLVQLEDIYNSEDNLYVLGKDKCGKTSLLKRIQLEYLMNYSRYNRIPYYIDAKIEDPKVDDTYNIANGVRNYYGLNAKHTESILSSEQLVLLIDNFKPEIGLAAYIEQFMQKYPKVRLIATGEELINRGVDFDRMDFGKQRSSKVYSFADLRRKEIIQYTNKQLKHEKNRSLIQDKIIKLCEQMELPYNYWTISLFLLIHHKESDTYSKNLFAILDICVDEIFGKKKLAILKSRITFVQLKTLCASLAKYLFENHETDVYSAPKNIILHHLQSEIDKNKRYSVDADAVLEFFYACGMLRIRKNGNYVFRLNGFFEYFLAYQMKEDELFRKKVLENDALYLGFKNQLEIYSGLNHNDSNFLKYIFEKTKKKCNPLFAIYEDNKDNELLKKIGLPQKLEDRCRSLSINGAKTALEKAEIEDALDDTNREMHSEVHLLHKYDPKSANAEVVVRYIDILARVFRNIDMVSADVIKVEDVFEYLLNYYCDYGFYLVDEMYRSTDKEIEQLFEYNLSENEALGIMRMVTNVIPIVVQMAMFDGIGHYSVERLVEEEISRLVEKGNGNQYRLFILYFLLFDLTLEGREKDMDCAIERITIPSLRYMMHLKLNYYMAFKSDGNKQIQTMLSDKIRKMRYLLDNKTQSTSIDASITDIKKEALVNKNIKG